MTSDDLKKTAKDIGEGASEAAGRGRKTVKDTASTVSDQALGAAEQAAGTAQDLYGRAKDGMSGLSDALPGSASDTIEAGKRAYSQGSDQLSKQIAKQPIEALLLAGAIGYLVGWAANRG